MRYQRISENSQRAIRWKNAYNRSAKYIDIYSCYNEPSIAKRNAYVFCVSEMCSQGGWGKRIIGHNAMQFTFAYLYDDFRTGIYLRVITKSHNYEMLWNPF